jgi:neutral ceramidase
MQSPPTAKAVVLDNGVSYLAIAKLDAVGVTDVLTERVIQLAKQRLSGKYSDLEGKLILNGSHTHDAGCRYSRWSVDTQLTEQLGFTQFDPLGNALAHGFDTYSQEATDDVANSVVDAIQTAITSLQPAKFGYAAGEDTDDLAGHDRRCAHDHLYGPGAHDRRAVTMRLDNSQTGAPIAVMFNFAMHGTFYDAYNHFLSVDAPGTSEYFVERQFNQPVVAMYLQGNAGDVSPSGGSNDGQTPSGGGEGSSEDMQHAGWELSQLVMRSYNSVDNWQQVLPLQVKERWTAISYDILGYPKQGDEIFDGGVNTDGYFYPYGSVLCFQLANNQGVNPGCMPPVEYTPTQITDDTGGLGLCGFAPVLPGKIVNGVATGSKYATRVAAARIGDLGIAAVPGEPLIETGTDIINGIRGGEFDGIKDAIVIGYAQDHNGYLLEADDWRSGGYEPTITFWGWKYGAYQVQQSIDIFREMFTGKAAYPNPPQEMPNLEPDAYTRVVPTNSMTAPAMTQDLPSTSQRITPLLAKFDGADPGLGTPLIQLQTQVNDAWVDVTQPTTACGDLTASCWTSGWIPVSNLSEDDIVVWYAATPTFLSNPTATTRAHAWQFEYEPPIDLPVGSYRFHISGQVKLNNTQSGFDLYTAAVQITPSTGLTLDTLLQASSGQLTFDATLLYPQAMALFSNLDNPDWQTANYRALTPRWGNQFSPAVPASTVPAATLMSPGGSSSSLPLTYVERTLPDTQADYRGKPNTGSALHGQITVSGAGTYTLSIPTITDVYGNTSQPTMVTGTL